MEKYAVHLLENPLASFKVLQDKVHNNGIVYKLTIVTISFFNVTVTTGLFMPMANYA